MWFPYTGVARSPYLGRRKSIRLTMLVLSCGTVNSDEIFPVEFDIVDGRTIRAYGFSRARTRATLMPRQVIKNRQRHARELRFQRTNAYFSFKLCLKTIHELDQPLPAPAKMMRFLIRNGSTDTNGLATARALRSGAQSRLLHRWESQTLECALRLRKCALQFR